MMNSKIAAFHISMIPQRWYKDIYQDELNLQESIIFNNKEGIHENGYMDGNILLIQKFATIPTTASILKKAVCKRNLYGHVWGLTQTATLLAVEQDDEEITIFLWDYIRRKSHQDIPRSSPVTDERPEISNNNS